MTDFEILDSMNLCPSGGEDNIVLKAMSAARADEREKVDVGFAEYIRNQKWEPTNLLEGWCRGHFSKRQVATTPELYQLFLKTIKP